MLVFFAIFPPKEISKKINYHRKKYDKNHERLAPHITLIPPFVPKKDISKAIKILEKQIGETVNFKIRLSGIGSFRKRLNSVVFVDVEDKNNLKELQIKMFEFLEPYGAKRGKYKDPNFHITIAKRLRFSKYKKILQELEKVDFKDEFIADKLSLCVIEKNEPWQIKKTIMI